MNHLDGTVNCQVTRYFSDGRCCVVHVYPNDSEETINLQDLAFYLANANSMKYHDPNYPPPYVKQPLLQELKDGATN